VTEIPEHLLKRSRERRAAVSGGDAGGETPAATPATTGSTAPAAAASAPATPAGPAGRAKAAAPAAPPPPEKVHPTVVAAKSRRKIPFWAMAALSLMPVWGFMYARSLTDRVEPVEGPLGLGAEVYGSCASCHGGDGGGGVGYAFTGGSILATFPNIEDQLRFTYYGTGAYQLAGIEIYGNPDREGGPHVTGAQGVMPQQGSSAGGDLTDYEILAVVCHERYALGGADPTSAEWAEEFETWCSEESEIFAGLQDGSMGLTTLESSVEGIIPIGMEPAPGSPASE
jgi:hypothetical protein